MTRYHLAGDSTVAPAKPPEHPMAGWGTFLAERLGFEVCNHAFGGATTQSFLEAGSWQRLLDGVRSGDVVVIQFGHNDQKEAELDARGGFTDRLRAMITDVRERDGRAVLCTPVERRWFDGSRVDPTHGDYPNAVRELARSTGTPLVDLTAFTTWLYEDLGDRASRSLLSHYAPGEYPGWPDGLTDDTHFSVTGARRIAAFVALSLRAMAGLDGDRPAKGRRGIVP